MPKIDPEGRPTHQGMTGHVVNAAQEIHEVDPSRNVDGTVADGYESDERELKDDENYQSPAVGEPPAVTSNNPAYREERDGDPQHPDSNDGNAQDQLAEREKAAREAEGQADAGEDKAPQGKGEGANRPTGSKDAAGVTTGTASKAQGGDSSSRGSSSSASGTQPSGSRGKK